MRITNQDVIKANRNIYKRNCTARYDSPEEMHLTLAATAGMLSIWNPYVSKENITSGSINENHIETSPLSNNIGNGLPIEIGQFIGSYLNRKDAAKVVQVCRNTNNLACHAKKSFLEKNGKSYKEENYMSLLF